MTFEKFISAIYIYNMKYSQQQLENIALAYHRMNMENDLKKLMSDAIQSVIINNQLPEDLLDSRNSNDIENDILARKREYLKYTTKLFSGNSAEILNLQKLLEDSN